MKFIDSAGRAREVGDVLGRGGEGIVYEIADEEGLAAKVYSKPLIELHADKIRAMVRIQDHDLQKFTAWPVGTLRRDDDGPDQIAGILMRRVRDAMPIHEVYNPGARKKHFPGVSWSMLIRVARNCAAAFNILHRCGVIVGDVNQDNILVSKDAMVALIDCDSFQVKTNKRLFTCEMAVPDYLAPELHGQKLSEVERTTNHDNFALAVLIFRVLFMGRHPYVGYQGKGDMSLVQAIQEHRFSFGRHAKISEMAPPPFSLTLSAVPADLAELLESAFDPHADRIGRPAAQLWLRALKRLEQSLCRCRVKPRHVYHNELQGCPWCAIEERGGPNYFPTKEEAEQKRQRRRKRKRDGSTIHFQCNHCGKDVSTPISMAGKKGQCPKCKMVMRIPKEQPKSVPPATKTETPGDMADADGDLALAPETPRDTIEFPCPTCGHLVMTPVASRGKKGKCPQCEHVFRIP